MFKATRRRRLSSAVHAVMKGGGFYNKHSGWQQAVQDTMFKHIIESARTCALPLPESCKTWCIIDLGCSQGRNSMIPISAILKEVRNRSPRVPANVLHVDLPNNDFSTLFHVLAGEGSYMQSFGDVYPAAIGRSYYNRLVSSSEVHMLLALVTLHWLPQAPDWGPTAWNQWHQAVTPDALAACRRQASKDLSLFLEHRAVECTPGAKLIMSMVATDDAGNAGSSVPSLVDTVLEQLVSEGVVQRSSVSQISIPIYCRREEDLQAVLDLPHVRATFSVETVQLDFVRHPVELQYEAGETSWEAVVDAIVGGVIAIWEPSLLAPFHDAAQRQLVKEELPRRLRSAMLLRPGEFGFSWHHMFTVLTRR